MPVALAVLLALAAPFSADDGEDVRILVARGDGTLELRGRGLERDGETARAVHPDRLSLSCRSGSLHGDGLPSDLRGATFRADGKLELLGRSLRGEIELRCAKDRWTAINVLPIEEYLAAVLGGEMSPSFPRAALEAQAVAARTYAIERKMEARTQGRAWHLDSTALSQVYRGAGWEDPRTQEAARATRGEILAVGYFPVEAYFHASCGGRTETGAEALGREQPYLRSVSCPCGGHSPWSHWSVRVTPDELSRLARRLLGGSEVSGLSVVARSSTGRAKTLLVETSSGTRRIGASELRALLGYARLPSLWFDVRAERSAFVFEGRGAGHGAGLCQWGARAMALAGSGYREILAHYYPGTSIVRIY